MSRQWRGVPSEISKDWQDVFGHPSDGHILDQTCPNCGTAPLRRYFDSVPGCRGSVWEWCGNCQIYEHASVIVPGWWQSDLTPDADAITAEPEALEDAHQARFGDAPSHEARERQRSGAPRDP